MGDPAKTTHHSTEVSGLDPESTYYFKTMWEDSDGNQGFSNAYAFQTGLRPKILEVKVINIGLETATITWQHGRI